MMPLEEERGKMIWVERWRRVIRAGRFLREWISIELSLDPPILRKRLLEV